MVRDHADRVSDRNRRRKRRDQKRRSKHIRMLFRGVSKREAITRLGIYAIGGLVIVVILWLTGGLDLSAFGATGLY